MVKNTLFCPKTYFIVLWYEKKWGIGNDLQNRVEQYLEYYIYMNLVVL